MIGHHVSTGHKSDYAVAHSGKDMVQIIDAGPDSIHWVIVREGNVEQKLALSFSTLPLLFKAVSLMPDFQRMQKERS